MPHITGDTVFNSYAMPSGRTFQNSLLLSKEEQDTDYFLWSYRNCFQSPEDLWVDGGVTGRSQVPTNAIFLKRSHYIWNLISEHGIAQNFPLRLLNPKGDIEAGWFW